MKIPATTRRPAHLAAAALLALAAAACTSATAAGPGTARSQTAPVPRADRPAVDLSPAAPLPFSEADVRFMSGMIPHHAQAVLIAGWAPSSGARHDVRILAERIVVSQRDEIELMQMWLHDRGLPAVDADPSHMMHAGMDHALMPGMLNAEELARLSRARGTEFDRLFLEYMIRHHEGAITMVDELFASEGAAQDEVVFRFASDVYADQTSEIDRMTVMMSSLPASGQP